MKKELSSTDLSRLEKKINLLNDKIDRLMEFLNVELVQPPDIVRQEEEKKRKIRERQQAKIIEKENSRKRMDRFKEDLDLRYSLGFQLRRQFNLLLTPSVNRIREYQRTNSPKAFEGLARKK